MPAYALTIFTGAFLLFQVQPVIGKYILPWFGGGPGVWTVCLLFFQLALLAGYAYAHLAARWLRPRAQALLHLVLVLAALALLPITPADSWKPLAGQNPTWHILVLLAATIGLPYFVLAATGPLLQQWLVRTHPAASVYRFYALSNAGSLLALVSFPFFFETHLSRRSQAAAWGWGLLAYAVGCVFCALKVWKAERRDAGDSRLEGPDKSSSRTAPADSLSPRGTSGERVGERGAGASQPRDGEALLPGPLPTPASWGEGNPLSDKASFESIRPGKSSTLDPRPSTRTLLLWLVWPMCGSVLLLAVTNKSCQDVAVVPFLWVLPLALYLLSFVICFDHPRRYAPLPFALLLIAALCAVCWAMFQGTNAPLRLQLAAYLTGLFICCLVCHGELYRLRPPPSYLTGFYLMIAAGGAAGGLTVALAAPLLFNSFYELHFGLLLCAALFTLTRACEQAGALLIHWRWLACALTASVFAGLDWALARVARHSQLTAKALIIDLRLGIWVVVLALVGSWLARKKFKSFRFWKPLACAWLWLGLIALAATLWLQGRKTSPDIVYNSRNFYGVLTVFEHQKEDPTEHHFLLQHGRITHGLQFADAREAAWPTTYYAEQSGIGLAAAALPPWPRRIGVVGLGTGTVAAYAQPGDYVRLYEINPEVNHVANSFFTYLSNCLGRVEVVPGDARLSLEREPSQQFDLLALDAFSSDAIPVHLLTKEAFDVYERHMKPNGIIAVHISNHYLDLEPVVANVARQFHYKMAIIDYDEFEDDWWLYSCTWILLTHDETILDRPAIRLAATTPHTNSAKVPLWTDDFASLYQILK